MVVDVVVVGWVSDTSHRRFTQQLSPSVTHRKGKTAFAPHWNIDFIWYTDSREVE